MSEPRDLRELWGDIEEQINQALLLSGPMLDGRAIVEVRHFLDHNELGLAFSTFVDNLHGTPSGECQEALRRAAQLMGIEPLTFSN
jgi:hypothetical protein